MAGNTLTFGTKSKNEDLEDAAANSGFATSNKDYMRTVIERLTKFDKAANWERCGMTTAQGAAALDSAYRGSTFDGRYIYFVPYYSDTFVRFDTNDSFTDASSWEQMSMSIAQGAAALDSAYMNSTFDGRYIYFVPYYSDTFVRFDTNDSFTDAGNWERISMSTAQGSAVLDDAYTNSTFDGRYVYFVPFYSDTFIRFDTNNSFTDAGSWEQVSMSTAQDAAILNAAYQAVTFDGRYVYFAPRNSDTFIRFDTNNSFTDAGSWEQVSMSIAQGSAALNSAYISNIFDGRYVYFVSYDSDTFVRFDTNNSFTDASSWEQMSMSTAQNATNIDAAYVGGTFDGRYVYFVPFSSDTFIRFDTNDSFTEATSWEQISMSTAQNATALNSAYTDGIFDGRYVYFVPYKSDTFVRFAGMESKKGYGKL